MKYYVALNGSQAGPFLEQELKDMFAAGTISGETLVWREGLSEWLPLNAVLPLLLMSPSGGSSKLGISEKSVARVPASRGLRLLATVIDCLPVLLACIPLIVFSEVHKGNSQAEPSDLYSVVAIGVFLLVLLLIGAGQIYLLVKYSQTIGKRVCKIRIYDFQTGQRADWIHTILLRILANGAIGGIPCVGGIYSLVDILYIFREDRRCVHDLLAGTVVGTVPE